MAKISCTFVLFVLLGKCCLITVKVNDSVQDGYNQACINGCNLYFEPGIHTTINRLGCNWEGNETHLIEIYGDSRYTTTLYRPNRLQNLMDPYGTYFSIHDLELKGGSFGLRFENSTTYSQFYNLIIHDNKNAFTMNRENNEYAYNTMTNIEIYNTNDGEGEGMYLGCNNNGCLFHDNIIQFCYIHDTKSKPVFGNTQGYVHLY